ncbi:MAG: GTP 3',8-cyclase MoaA [Treponema sp.]|nr:GTP 3',8-cyclase MoaA [Treponema sp.]
MQDCFGRTIDYLRISVTDRCNLCCKYCITDGIKKLPMESIMTYEQIVHICKAAVSLGITKFKITGGEPLVRKNVCSLVKMIKEIPGVKQVTMTTNGILLNNFLTDLIKAKVDGINISLDTLNPSTFEKITGFDGIAAVLQSIQSCLDMGVNTKLNCILQKNVNKEDWYDLLNFVRDKSLPIRFIELMPIGCGKISEGINNYQLLKKIENTFGPSRKISNRLGNGPAHYVKLPGFKSEIGFISAVNKSFCSECNRLRLTSLGQIKLCLCYEGYVDLMPCFKLSSQEEIERELKKYLIFACFNKPHTHHFEEPKMITEKRLMAQIGG